MALTIAIVLPRKAFARGRPGQVERVNRVRCGFGITQSEWAASKWWLGPGPCESGLKAVVA